MQETRFYRLDGMDVSYDFARKNIQSLRLRMRKDGSLAVSAPIRMEERKIEAFLKKNEEFLRKALTRQKEYVLKNRFEEGVYVYFFGEEYRLTLREGKEDLSFAEGQAILTHPKGKDPEATFHTLLGARLLPVIRRECAAFEMQFPAYAGKARDIRVRRMRSVWGNCRPKEGRLTFSTELAFMPLPLIVGVIAHEYTHFFQGGHGAAFYAALQKTSPDYKKLSEEINLQRRKQKERNLTAI